MSASSRTMCRERSKVLRWPELPLAEKEQRRDHAAGPRRDKRGGDSFDPSPSSPIGLQVLHDTLRHLNRSTRLAPRNGAALLNIGKIPVHLRMAGLAREINALILWLGRLRPSGEIRETPEG